MGSILRHFWGRNFDRFSRCVCAYFFTDFDLHFGSILGTRTAPGATPTRKGRPLILNNPPMKIKLFDPVMVAGGSHVRSGDALENVTLFISKFCHQNVCKTTPKWLPKGTKTASKNDPEIASKKYCKTYQKLLQNGTQNGARGVRNRAPALPRAPPGHRDLPKTSPGPPRTSFWQSWSSPGHYFLINLLHFWESV